MYTGNTGKRILNKGKELNTEQRAEEENGLIIRDEGDRLNISISKHQLSTMKPMEINRMLLMALSPLFLSQLGTTRNHKQPEGHINYQSFKNIVFFIEQMPHYTGGRYSIFHQALLLSHYTKVTVVSNMRPPFFEDFHEYFNSNFTFIEDVTFLSQNDGHSGQNYDLVIGCPVQGGIMAAEWARKHSKPLVMIMFESPNWVKQYRDGADADETFWTSYKECLFQAQKIMVPSHESKKYLLEWLGNVPEEKVEVVYPCINEITANAVSNNAIMKQVSKKELVFISRMIPAKSPLAIIKKLNKTKFNIHIIGKVWTDGKNSIDKLIEAGYSISLHGKISDFEKFSLLRRADMLIFPTNFEGFGMPPMESLYYGVPVITYDLPVLKEIYEKYDNVHFVERGNTAEFVEKINYLAKNSSSSKQIVVNSMKNCADKLLDVCEIPKISVGMIVYNGSDYIEYSVMAIYDVVYEIIIVDGAIKKYNDSATVPYSTDGTLDVINNLQRIDKLGKIKFVPAKNTVWESEVEKRNQIAERVTGKYYVLIDHDEIWKRETLIDAINYMETNKHISALRMPFYHFWLSFNNIAVDEGGKWSTKHPRIWRWKEGFKHVKSFNYFQDTQDDYKKVGEPFFEEDIYEKDRVYHFGYCRSQHRLLQKIEYYRTRGIENCGIDTVSTWKEMTDTTQPTQKGVRSWAEKFTGSLPKILHSHPYFGIDDVRKIEE